MRFWGLLVVPVSCGSEAPGEDTVRTAPGQLVGYLVLDRHPHAAQGVSTAACDFWDPLPAG